MDTNMTPPQGVFVPFFGVEACTASGMARVALQTGAAVLPGFLVWEEAEKKYVLRFGEELELIHTGDADSGYCWRIRRCLRRRLRRMCGGIPSSGCGCTGDGRRGRRAKVNCTRERANDLCEGNPGAAAAGAERGCAHVLALVQLRGCRAGLDCVCAGRGRLKNALASEAGMILAPQLAVVGEPDHRVLEVQDAQAWVCSVRALVRFVCCRDDSCFGGDRCQGFGGRGNQRWRWGP